MKSRFIGCLFLLAACSSATTDSGPPPPTPESLFDNLPAASPNKLRGVWGQGLVTQPGGTIDVRFRFIESYVVGGAKCVPKTGDPLIAGKSITLQTNGLDAATGKLTMGALVFDKKTDTFQCGGGNPNGGTFDFAVQDNKLTLTLEGAQGAIVLNKIGD